MSIKTRPNPVRQASRTVREIGATCGSRIASPHWEPAFLGSFALALLVSLVYFTGAVSLVVPTVGFALLTVTGLGDLITVYDTDEDTTFPAYWTDHINFAFPAIVIPVTGEPVFVVLGMVSSILAMVAYHGVSRGWLESVRMRVKTQTLLYGESLDSSDE